MDKFTWRKIGFPMESFRSHYFAISQHNSRNFNQDERLAFDISCKHFQFPKILILNKLKNGQEHEASGDNNRIPFFVVRRKWN